jgi:hypothetical protein
VTWFEKGGFVRLRVFIVAALAAALVPTVALGSGAKKIELKATLTGGVEVPKGSPNGKGSAEVYLTGTKVCWEFKYSGIDAPTASHIHKAPAHKAGPVVIPFGTAFKKEGCTTTTPALAKAIVANPGAYYVNIHTAKYPAGALRGQLQADD